MNTSTTSTATDGRDRLERLEPKDVWEFRLDQTTGKRMYIDDQPVVLWPAKHVLKMESRFLRKKICTGPSFNLGDACPNTCGSCYGREARQFLGKEGLNFQNVVILRKNAVEVLKNDLEQLSQNNRTRDHVVYNSTPVDIAATEEMANETTEACALILQMTSWDIRLLSKSILLPFLIDQIPKEFYHRLIVGCPTGTFDEELAQAIDPGTALVSQRIENIRKLQDLGIRTFAMICPSIPMKSAKEYDELARSFAERLRYEKMEHVWAESINVYSDNFNRTIELLKAAGQMETFELMKKVYASKKDHERWEEYSRRLFQAHSKVVPPEKLRFPHYLNRDSDLSYWEEQESKGAIILGGAKARAAKKLNFIPKSPDTRYGQAVQLKPVQSIKLVPQPNVDSEHTHQSELSKTEQDELASCEATIRKGFDTLLEVGEALATIRDSRLYRQSHATFESYCRERWQFQRAHAHRQIGAAKVVKSLSPNGDTALPLGVPLPSLEAQVRPLVGLDANEAREAWVKAAKEANGSRVTARLVKAQIPHTKNTKEQSHPNPKSNSKINFQILTTLNRIEEVAASTSAARELSEEILKLRVLFSAERNYKSSDPN